MEGDLQRQAGQSPFSNDDKMGGGLSESSTCRLAGNEHNTINTQHGEFELVQQSKRFVPGSLVGIKDIDFVGRSEAETP